MFFFLFFGFFLFLYFLYLLFFSLSLRSDFIDWSKIESLHLHLFIEKHEVMLSKYYRLDPLLHLFCKIIKWNSWNDRTYQTISFLRILLRSGDSSSSLSRKCNKDKMNHEVIWVPRFLCRRDLGA